MIICVHHDDNQSKCSLKCVQLKKKIQAFFKQIIKFRHPPQMFTTKVPTQRAQKRHLSHSIHQSLVTIYFLKSVACYGILLNILQQFLSFNYQKNHKNCSRAAPLVHRLTPKDNKKQLISLPTRICSSMKIRTLLFEIFFSINLNKKRRIGIPSVGTFAPKHNHCLLI